MNERRGAVGVFDSGVGGLTVFRRIIEKLPDESAIYLGDTARVPYGTKSPETVIRYARGCAKILLERGIRMLVVACNTASAYALEALREELPVPVLGVIEPGARNAVAATRTGRIGVIGTAGTIRSGRYQGIIRSLAPEVEVFCKACPLFVPLAEEGWTEGEVPRRIASAYLSELVGIEVDTLVLGCTHYPLLKHVIAEAMGEGVTLVDSAEATAEATAQTIEAGGVDFLPGRTREFLVTDDPEGFARVGRRFLGLSDTGGEAGGFGPVEWVDV